MEKRIKRQYKANLILGMIVYCGVFLIGIIPWLLYGDSFWDQNVFLSIVGGVLLFIWFIAVFSYIHVNLFAYKPFFKLNTTVQIIDIILILFTLDIFLMSEENLLSSEIGIWIMLAIGLFVIASNLFVLIVYWEKKPINSEKSRLYIMSLKSYEYDLKKQMALLSHLIPLTMYIVAIAVDFVDPSEFILIFFFNAYFMYKYLKVMKPTLQSKIILVSLAVILYTVMVLIFVMFNDFMNQSVVIKSLLAFIPIAYIIPNIFKIYYTYMLKEQIE